MRPPNPDDATARVLSRIPGWEDMSDMRLVGRLCELVEDAEDRIRPIIHAARKVAAVMDRISPSAAITVAESDHMEFVRGELRKVSIDAALAGGEEGKKG